MRDLLREVFRPLDPDLTIKGEWKGKRQRTPTITPIHREFVGAHTYRHLEQENHFDRSMQTESYPIDSYALPHFRGCLVTHLASLSFGSCSPLYTLHAPKQQTWFEGSRISTQHIVIRKIRCVDTTCSEMRERCVWCFVIYI